MKSLLKLTAYLLLLASMACASTQNKATPEQISALEKMVANKHFEIKAQWAQPLVTQSLNSIANSGLLPPGSTASRIEINGAANYLRMVGDSVMADLPFFGERRMGGGYNQSGGGIVFEGVPRDFTITPNKKDDGRTVRFSISGDSEDYQVIAQLYPNGLARLNISSTHRTNMWYQGDVFPYKEE
ncbi:MAG: DUF4251 domain-containing protein [Algicola sp.]|nr:DUF4251 domain-containing protein [Algicola sp.]